MPEVRLNFEEIGDPQSITPKVAKAIAEAMGEGHAMHRYDVEELIDDEQKRQRILKIQPKRTYIVLGGGS